MQFRYIVLLAIVLFLVLFKMRPARFSNARRPVAASVAQPLRITQFYPAAANVPRGEKTMLCYGVDGATAVRLSPAVEQVWPAFTRCFDIFPPHTTKYTLTAENAQGQTVSESTVVDVGPARTRILEVSVNKTEVARGQLVTLCFKAANASNFDVGGLQPVTLGLVQVIPSPERGCFGDRPQKTKTYVVKVKGPGGEDSERVTVTVK